MGQGRPAALRQPSALTRFGRPHDELLGAHLSELVQAHAVELSAQYIDGALAGRPQQVERAMVDRDGQRYNAHQVTHIPNVVDGAIEGYCALAVDITASIEGYEHARHVRERAALRAVRERIAGDINNHHVVDDLSDALERLDAALERATDAVPSLRTAADAIDRTIAELRAMLPARLIDQPDTDGPLAAFPSLPARLSRRPPPVGGSACRGRRTSRDAAGQPSTRAGCWTCYRRRSRSGTPPCAMSSPIVPQCAGSGAPIEQTRWASTRATCSAPRRSRLRTSRMPRRPCSVNRSSSIARSHTRRPAAPAGVLRTADAWRRGGRIYSIVIDVTSRVQADLALQDARAALASARERERIAERLHNLVIQRLFAAGLAARLAAPGVAHAQVRSVQDGIVGALEDLESAITTLHDNVGLLDLLPDLARLVHNAAQPNDIAAAIENVGAVEYVPTAVGAELLAVAEAALSNVAIHSGASSVVVTIAADAAGVWLRVVDDGRGIGAEPQGKGMADMASRAARLGGTCTWHPNAPSGTRVYFRVPLPQ